MKVLLVGANGGIGRFLRTCLPRDLEMFYLVRSQDASVSSCKEIVVDLSDQSAVNAIKLDFDAIIYAAGFWDGRSSSPNSFFQNLTPFLNFIQAMLPRTKKFIFLSSSAIYSDETLPREPFEVAPPKSAYGQAKLIAEQILWQSSNQLNVECIAIRPFHVATPLEAFRYGRSHILTDFFHRLTITRSPFDLSDLPDDVYVPLYWVGDLASVIMDCIEASEGKRYDVLNVGNKLEFSVRSIASELTDYVGQANTERKLVSDNGYTNCRVSAANLSRTEVTGAVTSRSLAEIIQLFGSYKQEF